MRYAIQYDSENLLSGESVGTVYAVDIGHISPRCWSYSKDLAAATTFDTEEEAQRVRTQHSWNASRVVEAS